MRSVVFLFALALLAEAAGLPKTLISEDETEPIRSAIVRKEAWTTDAVRRLRTHAERRLKEGLWSVTFDRPPNADLDPHDYFSDAPNWWPNPDNPNGPYIRKEGQPYPGRFTANKTALTQMSDTVFTLGAAALLLEDPHFARRASRIVHAWFVNPKTRMNPNLEHAQTIPGINDGQGGGILEGRVLIRAIQGIEFLSQTGSWDANDQAAVHKWFEEYLRWLTKSPAGEEEKASGNDHASWWAAQVAAVASFVEDEPEMQAAINFYRDRVFPRTMRMDVAAQRPLSYLALNLEADTTICRIAQIHGINIWSTKTKNGATLAALIDSIQPVLADTHKPGKEPAPEFSSEGVYFLAFAGMGMNKPDYVALYRKLERPDTAWLNVIDLLAARWESSGHQTRH